MNSFTTTEFITKTESVKCSYKWKLENFFSINIANGEEICSPSFTIHKNDKVKWFLSVFPKGYEDDNKDFVSVYLYPESKNNNHLIHYEFSIINNKKIKENILLNSHHFQNESDGVGSSNFIAINLLEKNKETLLPNNNLTICCDIEATVYNRTFAIYTDNRSKRFKPNEEQMQTCMDLGTLFKKQELTDIVLITNNGELKAHKAILAARSPVFLAMLTNDMTENLKGEIKIIHFDSEVVSEMLEFMYTGKIKNIEKNAVDLLRIADKYQILGLKNLCENFLLSTISIENASDLLIIADQCNCKDLKTNVIKFILSHKKEIISTPKFIDLKTKHHKLIFDLFYTDC